MMEQVIYQHKVDYIVEEVNQEDLQLFSGSFLGTIWGNMDKNCKIVEYDYEMYKNQ